MAGPRARLSPCRNSLLTGKDELAGAAFSKGSGSFRPTPIVSCSPTPTPATTLAVGLSLNNKLFKQFIKAFLEAQVSGQTEVDLEPREQPFKVQFLDPYYGNLHIDCYLFCQQCEDHFKTAGAKWLNRNPFATWFLCGLVTQQWLQHKQRRDGAMLMTWPEFKEFLQKYFGDFRAFVDSVWKKVKRDSQYQDKLAQDSAAYLEYLQSILIEFDSE